MITEAERSDNVFSHRVQPLKIASFFFSKHCLVVCATEPVSNELNHSMSIMLFSPHSLWEQNNPRLHLKAFERQKVTVTD